MLGGVYTDDLTSMVLMNISSSLERVALLSAILCVGGCAMQKTALPVQIAVPAQVAVPRQTDQPLPADADRLRPAIATFFSFYSINADTRMNYCRGLGVDISLFIIAFTQANLDVYTKAVALGATYQVTENAVFFEAERTAVAVMDKNMAERAAADHITTTELCDWIRYNPEIMASSLIFSMIRPDIYKMLMDQ